MFIESESVIETKGAKFLLYLDEYGLPRFGLFGVDAQLLITGLPEKTKSLEAIFAENERNSK